MTRILYQSEIKRYLKGCGEEVKKYNTGQVQSRKKLVWVDWEIFYSPFLLPFSLSICSSSSFLCLSPWIFLSLSPFLFISSCPSPGTRFRRSSQCWPCHSSFSCTPITLPPVDRRPSHRSILAFTDWYNATSMAPWWGPRFAQWRPLARNLNLISTSC